MNYVLHPIGWSQKLYIHLDFMHSWLSWNPTQKSTLHHYTMAQYLKVTRSLRYGRSAYHGSRVGLFKSLCHKISIQMSKPSSILSIHVVLLFSLPSPVFKPKMPETFLNVSFSSSKWFFENTDYALLFLFLFLLPYTITCPEPLCFSLGIHTIKISTIYDVIYLEMYLGRV